MPKYVKIDTEGFDFDVLLGMSRKPSLVSFEFVPKDMSVATNCARFLEGYLFNFVTEENANFELSAWVGEREIIEALKSLPPHVLYGDVFAKA